MDTPLRPGQEIVLSSLDGAVDCRVVAAAGEYVLLRPVKPNDVLLAVTFSGVSSLTFLDGMVPVGVDGAVEPGGLDGEIRFHVHEKVDRRSSVRVPVFADSVARLPNSEPLPGTVIDISAGGLRFRHQERRRVMAGTAIRVYCKLPGDLELDADGIVRSSLAGVVSVQFTRMNGVSSADIGRWTVDVLRAHLNQG